MSRLVFPAILLLSSFNTSAVLADSADDRLIAQLKNLAQSTSRPLPARLNAIDMLGKLGPKDADSAVKALDELLSTLDSSPPPLLILPRPCGPASAAPAVSYAMASSEPQRIPSANEPPAPLPTAPPVKSPAAQPPAASVKPPAKIAVASFDTSIRALYVIRSLGNYGPAARHSLANIARFNGLDHALDRVIADAEQSVLLGAPPSAPVPTMSAPPMTVPPPPQPLEP